MYKLTQKGKQAATRFIEECQAKRKELLNVKKDTADDTSLPTVEDIESDINFIDLDSETNDYYNGWAVTDSYDSDTCLHLVYGVDFIEVVFDTTRVNAYMVITETAGEHPCKLHRYIGTERQMAEEIARLVTMDMHATNEKLRGGTSEVSQVMLSPDQQLTGYAAYDNRLIEFTAVIDDARILTTYLDRRECKG